MRFGAPECSDILHLELGGTPQKQRTCCELGVGRSRRLQSVGRLATSGHGQGMHGDPGILQSFVVCFNCGLMRC